jgi:hypothetical protein
MEKQTDWENWRTHWNFVHYHVDFSEWYLISIYFDIHGEIMLDPLLDHFWWFPSGNVQFAMETIAHLLQFTSSKWHFITWSAKKKTCSMASGDITRGFNMVRPQHLQSLTGAWSSKGSCSAFPHGLALPVSVSRSSWRPRSLWKWLAARRPRCSGCSKGGNGEAAISAVSRGWPILSQVGMYNTHAHTHIYIIIYIIIYIYMSCIYNIYIYITNIYAYE